MDLKLLFIIKSICSIVHMVTMEESNFRNFIRVANILSIKGRFNTAFFSELKIDLWVLAQAFKTISR